MARLIGYGAAGFIAAGFSEVFTVLFGVVLGGLWLHYKARKYLAAAIGLAIGFGIVGIAPGNAIRQIALAHTPEFIPSLSQTLVITAFYLKGQVLYHLGALLLAVGVGYLCRFKNREVRNRLAIPAILVSMFALIYLSLFIPVYLTGGLDTRHFTFASLILVIGLGAVGALCGES